MQTGSSGTLIGWKSGQTTFVPLWDRMEGAWLRPRRNIGNLTSHSTEYTELQPLLSGIHSVMRVKFALAGKGGGCTPTPHPLLLHLPSPVKLQCTLQLSGQIHWPFFISCKDMYSVGETVTTPIVLARTYSYLESARRIKFAGWIFGVHGIA